MLRDFDISKIIFRITEENTVIDNRSIKVYLDYNHSLPLGRVRLFKSGDKIYGRIKYYMNLEAWKLVSGRLGTSYPSLSLIQENGVWKVEYAYISGYQRDVKIECIGKQLLKRKLTSLGLQCFRQNKPILQNIFESSQQPLISMTYAGAVTPEHVIIAEMLIDRRSQIPISILYESPSSGKKKLFYLNEL